LEPLDRQDPRQPGIKLFKALKMAHHAKINSGNIEWKAGYCPKSGHFAPK